MKLCFAGLFNEEPVIGEINPMGEVHYIGYKRIPLIALNKRNLTEVIFPAPDQDEPVFVSHVAVLDANNKVIGKRAISGDDIRIIN